MSTSLVIIAILLFFIVAALYSSAGHAGASGYLAVMALLAFAPESIKPTSLLLNVIVALIASYRFISQGYFDKKIFLAFALFSFPAAFIGGYLQLPAFYFKLLSGVFLVLSALFLLIKKQNFETVSTPKSNFWLITALSGLFIGFLSGIIGVGGGIFLTPLLLFLKWTEVKKVAGITALFILVNSLSGLLGHISSINYIDRYSVFYVGAVILGGLTGSYYGSKKFNTRIIIYCLFIILMSAGLKFIFMDTWSH